MKRFTTNYVDSQDRIRLTVLTNQDTALILWLTQRLTNRLIPQLCTWLVEPTPQPGASATSAYQIPMQHTLQHLTQQHLRTTSDIIPPVTATPETPSLLVHSIDITMHFAWIKVTFKDHAGQPLSALVLEPVPLRQWLNILCDQYIAAQWSMTPWPEWMQGQEGGAGTVAGQELVWH